MSAIAFDAAASGTALANTSLTYSHTNNGNLLIVGAGVENASDIVTGITYNGVAMTRIPTNGFETNNAESIYMYYLINPATGTHNVVVSTNTSTDIRSGSTSYTGAGSSQPDNSNKNTVNGSPGATSITTNVTTIANNCWLVSYCQSNSSTVSAGTGTTSRASTATQTIGDSNGAKTPPGSFSMQWTQAVAHGFNMIIISIAPPSGAGGSFLFNVL